MTDSSRKLALSCVLVTLGAVGFAWAGGFPAPGSQPSGMVHDGERLYVTEASDFRKIFALDPDSGAVLGSFLAPSRTGLDGGGNPNGLAHDGNGHLFVIDIDRIVFEIEDDGSAIVNSFELPFRGGAIAFDGTNLYVSDFDSDEALVLDRSGATLGGFATSLRPAGMSYDDATGMLWVISIFDEDISQMTVTGEIVRRCEGPRAPGPLGMGAITFGGGSMYVAEVPDVDPLTPGTIYVLEPDGLDCEPRLARTVAIDVRPGNPIAPVNPRSRGQIPVAVLSDQDFSADSVMPDSVRFGASGTEAHVDRWRLQDVNHDGRDDLLLWFVVAETGIRCGDDTARLTAVTEDGGHLVSSDEIHTVGCRWGRLSASPSAGRG